MRAGALALLALGCSGSATEPKAPPLPEVPERVGTAGDALLALAPTGADAILELDLGRLRANPIIGEVARTLTAGGEAGPGGGEGEGTAPRGDLLSSGDLVVIVSYAIGSDDTERLILLAGDNVARVDGATPLGDKVAAIASEAMMKRLRAVASGDEASLSSASQLIRLRALAMPENAEGAALRLAAHLDFSAQLALAKALDLDEVPVSISVWGDVADDLAIVALISGKDSSEGGSLAIALAGIRDKLAGLRQVRALALGAIIRRARVENRGAAARLVLLIGPRRLKRVVSRLLGRLQAPPPESEKR